MPTGSITNHDITMILLYMFFVFFLGLIWYLRREDRREGYPLVSDGADRGRRVRPSMTKRKVFLMAKGHELPDREAERDLNGLLGRTRGVGGSAFTPLGNPLIDAVGPAAYAQRADVPDLTFDEQLPKIVPLRAAPGFSLAEEDADPRGMSLISADRQKVGVITDVWVDRSEVLARYFEAEIDGPAGKRQVLVPVPMADIDSRQRRIHVSALLGAQFADVPGLRHPEQITLLEEDKVSAYFSGGELYATPRRIGPLL